MPRHYPTSVPGVIRGTKNVIMFEHSVCKFLEKYHNTQSRSRKVNEYMKQEVEPYAAEVKELRSAPKKELYKRHGRQRSRD